MVTQLKHISEIILYLELKKNTFPIELPKPSVLKTIPPTIKQTTPLLGFTPENVHESFFWSTHASALACMSRANGAASFFCYCVFSFLTPFLDPIS